MAEPHIAPIEQADLDEVGRFLSDNLNRRITPQSWIQALVQPWSESRPNFGMQLRNGNALAGVFCAIYSDQMIDGRQERFCNPHSWCVLEPLRRHGIGLILALLRQSQYHFTMLTPNPKVAEIFRRLGFRDLADPLVRFPNAPSVAAGARGHITICDRDRICDFLDGPTLRDYLLHRDIPWLRFVVFGTARDMCLVVYKRMRWKRLPGARLLHVSDPQAFDRHRGLLSHHLLTREGLIFSQAESRFLSRTPAFALRSRRTQPKLLLSATLRDTHVSDLYSELVALDV